MTLLATKKQIAASLLAAMLVACKDAPKEQPATSANAGTATSNASPSAAVSVAISPSASASASRSLSFSGKYVAEVGEMYVPDGGDYKGFKWRGDPAGPTGEGTLTLRVLGDQVDGELTGPLGKQRIAGRAEGAHVVAMIIATEKDPPAYSGILEGDLTDAGINGSVRWSSSEARYVRKGTFEAKRGQ